MSALKTGGSIGRAEVGVTAPRPVLLRILSVARGVVRLLLSATALVAAVSLRVFRRVVWIRIGAMDGRRLGHWAMDVELYLAGREVDRSADFVDLFHYRTPPCNGALARRVSRTLRVVPWIGRVDRWNRLLPHAELHVVPLGGTPGARSRDVRGLLSRTRPHLAIDPPQGPSVEADLLRLGLSADATWVCMHARDRRWLSETIPSQDWSYHDYRDSDIDTCRLAAVEMVRRGLAVVRMGARVKKPFDCADPRVIDYAWRGRTEELDLQLTARSQFCVCDTSGFWALAALFRRPVVWVNFIPMEYVPGYTVDDPTRARALLHAGCKGIITNQPGRLKSALQP